MCALESKQMLKMSSFGTHTDSQERRRTQELSAANGEVQLAHSKRLMNKYLDSDVYFIWFTEEKMFTVAT